MKRIYIKEQVCIGCHLCEVYCQMCHSQSKDLIKAFKRESPRPLPRVRIEEKRPVLVIGGTAQDFLGEYMAGGILVLLGLNLNEGEHHKANFIGTGMHGGVIYLRGSVEGYQLGKEVGVAELEENDRKVLKKLVGEFADHFGYDAGEILKRNFIKLFPRWLRPYGRLYAY